MRPTLRGPIAYTALAPTGRNAPPAAADRTTGLSPKEPGFVYLLHERSDLERQIRAVQWAERSDSLLDRGITPELKAKDLGPTRTSRGGGSALADARALAELKGAPALVEHLDRVASELDPTGARVQMSSGGPLRNHFTVWRKVISGTQLTCTLARSSIGSTPFSAGMDG
jgi:hypothetical protein